MEPSAIPAGAAAPGPHVPTSVPGVPHAGADLLRLATAGSVDDGKSTLVGRLLHDCKAVLADQLEAVARASRDRGLPEVDLALLTDGLRAEREQGITIDVAYRYFATPRRRFVLADTPGHVQYTRNMVTGASTAQLAAVLVDARAGVVEQTRRHASVAALLRVPHVVLAVNKMDLVGYAEDVFARLADEFGGYARALGVPEVTAIPVSALHGDNVVEASPRMDWYGGPTLLEHLESVPVEDDPATQSARLSVQYVIRPGAGPHRDYRGYAGQVTSGVLRVGDEVVVLPAGHRTRVTGISRLGEQVGEAAANLSVAVSLADDLDVSRGDLIAAAGGAPEPTQDLDATVCWLADRPLRPGERLLVKHTTRVIRAVVGEVEHRLDISTLERKPAPATLSVNEIGRIRLRTSAPLAADPYVADRRTGSFLLIDEHDGTTLAAGMVGDPLEQAAGAGAP